MGQLQWHQYRGHFQLVEVRIREGHPIEVLLLLVDLVLVGRGQPPRGPPGRLMTQARVFSVTQQDADTVPDVVTGMILVFDCDAHILIDPGATHSFISMGFISNVNVESQPIDCSIVYLFLQGIHG